MIFQDKLSFDEHVTSMAKACSQRSYTMKLPRDQGLPQNLLDNDFQSLISPKYDTVYLSVVIKSVPHRRSKLMLCRLGSSSIVLPVGLDFGILIVYCMMQIHSFLRVCRITSIVSTVYSLTPETLHTLWSEETTHMNSRIIITAGLGVPLSTGPSTISLDRLQGGAKKYYQIIPNYQKIVLNRIKTCEWDKIYSLT